MSNILQAKSLAKTYRDGANNIVVLQELNLAVSAGEMVAIVGTSGAGKSTLLHLLGGLDVPTSGEVWLGEACLTTASESKKDLLRNQHLGFVYQFHHLLKEFNVLDNVALRLVVRGLSVVEARQQASELLQQVGLAERLTHAVSAISGGERQRVAIARALVGNPLCVLADEPTGNLDEATADNVFSLMRELNKTLQTSFIIVTHNKTLAAQCDRVLTLNQGSLVS